MDAPSARSDAGPAAFWVKSSRSQGENACLEVRSLPGTRDVRDSKSGDSGPVLAFGEAAFGAFIDAVKCGRFG